MRPETARALTRVTLSAVSKRGKQIIRQHGARWTVTQVFSCTETMGRIDVRPEGVLDSATVCNSRWVQLVDDHDFTIGIDVTDSEGVAA